MIAEEIRNIARPKNTILLPTKKENVYMVVERVGCKYDHGRRLPQNGKVIGHIIDKVYVPKEEKIQKLTNRSVSLLRYGNVAFADKMGNNLLLSLNQIYDPNDALNIYNLALMRASFGDIKDYQIDEKYHKCFASVLYPRRAVSKNSISTLLENIGLDYAGIHSFMLNRIKDLVSEKTKILIDGMLKSNTSNINSFVGFSYKGRIKGTTDISIICAFDADRKEPLCIKVYKGNLPDFVNCADFFDEFNLPNGLVISDKGFPLDKLKERSSCSKIAFLNPIKRSSKIIDSLDLTRDMEYVAGDEKHILGKKSKYGEMFYYSFLNINRESKEEYDYINGKKNKFDPKKFAKKKTKLIASE